ncbi:hypothetical protein [Streptomyces nitrosporeus]|uniref:hypothetical protein n=1 Tax=Streptomyces nitrosporeus TaxID=28894 RepID=UPI0039A2FE0F
MTSYTRTGKTYRRKPQTGDRTRGPARTWRVTASWDARPDRPAIRTTADKRARDRIAAEFAAQGGYVVIEETARGHGWRTLREIDGPAQLLAAEQAAAAQARANRDQAEADAREARHAADYAQQTARNTLAAALDATDARDRLMATPPGTRDHRARHTAGGR